MSAEQQEQYGSALLDTPKTNISITLGKYLRQAREHAGLTALQIAQDLHLDVRMIEAMERERFKELGAPVYVKGYLRRYARLVGVDEVSLSNLYDSLRDPPVNVDPIPVSLNSISEPRKLLPNWVLWAVASIFVVASVIAGLNLVSERQAADLIAQLPVAKSFLQTTSIAPSTAVNTDSVALTTQVVRPRDSLVLASAAPLTSAVANESSDEAMREPAHLPVAGHVALKLKFLGDSWVEIYDAKNRPMLYDMVRSASMREVEGLPPLRVVLGSAQQVALQINGRGAMVPGRRVAANVAHFVVNANGAID